MEIKIKNKSSYKQIVESRSCKNNSLWISNARFLKKNIDNLEEKKLNNTCRSQNCQLTSVL